MSLQKEKTKDGLNLNILKEFDYFGAEMKFLINNESSYRTKLGGGISLIYFIMSIAYVCYNFYHFASRNISTLSYSSKIIYPSPPMYLNSTKFKVSLLIHFHDNQSSALTQTSEYLDHNFYIENFNYTNEEDKFSIQRIPSAFCNESDFQSLPKNIFKLNSLNTSLCPIYEEESDKVIQGQFSDENFSFLSAVISIKDDVIKNSTKLSEFKIFLNENPLYVSLFMIDAIVDYEEYSDFLGHYLKQFNVNLSMDQVKEYEINLSKLIFRTDNNIFWPMPTEFSAVTHSESEYSSYIVEDRDLINIMDKKNLVIFSMKSSPKAFIYDRTYQKLNDFLANMTGILSQIVIILYVLMNYLNEKTAIQKVMRKIMKYKEDGNFHVDKILSLFNNHKQDTMKNKINNSKNSIKKDESQISKNDIELELQDIPASEYNPIDFSNSLMGNNRIFKVRKSNYEYYSEKSKSSNLNKNMKMNNSNQIKNQEKPENFIYLPVTLPNKSSTQRELISKEKDSNDQQGNFDVKNSFQNENKPRKRYSRIDIEIIPGINVAGNETKFDSSTKITKLKEKQFNQNRFKNNNLITKKSEFRPLKLTYYEILKNACCCSRRNKPYILFSIAEKKVMYYMDVLNYIKLLGDIDLLKQVLFNEQQRCIFEFLSKPLLDDKYAILDENYYIKKTERGFMINIKEIEGVYKCYNKLKQYNFKNSENSLRLIDMMNEEISILRNQQI